MLSFGIILIIAWCFVVAHGFQSNAHLQGRPWLLRLQEQKDPLSSPPVTTASDPAAPSPQRILGLESLHEFLAYIDEAPKDSLSVVKFYAKTCPLCRKIDVKYKKMALFYQTAPIRFAQVDKRIHPELCNTLGVDRFPFIQIYRNGQCVASHGVDSDRQFGPLVHDTIQNELAMRNSDWDAFLTAFAEPIRQQTETLQRLRDLQG